jgi:hypothetical protein
VKCICHFEASRHGHSVTLLGLGALKTINSSTIANYHYVNSKEDDKNVCDSYWKYQNAVKAHGNGNPNQFLPTIIQET